MKNKYIKYSIDGNKKYGIVLDKIKIKPRTYGCAVRYVVGVYDYFYDFDISERENDLTIDEPANGLEIQIVSPYDIEKYFEDYESMCREYYNNK